MSAGALQSAIDTLHKDEHVIVLTERKWYDKLEAIICHADKTPKAESPYYSLLSLILHTYGVTCTHLNLEASDFSLTVVLKDPDNPEGGRHQLGGWVKAKPKIRMCTKKANKNGKASADANADPGKQDLVDGQGGAGEVDLDGRNEQVDPDGRKEQVNLEDKKEQADAEDEEEADTEDEEEVNMEHEVEHAEEEVEDAEKKVEDAEEEVEDAEDKEEDMDAEDEREDSDTDAEDEEEEMDVEDEVQGRDVEYESNEAGTEHGARSNDSAGFDDDAGFDNGAGPDDGADLNHGAGPNQDAALDHSAGPDCDTGPNHGIAEPDKENKAEKHDAEKDRTLPNNVTQRLIADLPQLCKQAHYAFNNFKEDVIHAMLMYGMTFSLFRFMRPLNWDSIRGTDDHTRPETIFSDELILINKEFNPHFKHALHLLTASLGLSYQPSWFQLPSDYQIGTPDLVHSSSLHFLT
ncbi:hypothetical protein EWM64_g10807 [Hericium alpestre]|uniref:Uncharacterized protein n=1 Tax=Hericium alpestre TaxID=135208 RepID=A0A4Y9ZEK6_9AGAM|nr:hypothetical protein EWM64_g10807 [Hericium alpestre]